jgi:hypothetical protein
MTHSDDHSRRLQELLSLYIDGTLDDEQWDEFEKIVAASPEARKLYVEHVFLSAAIQRLARGAEAGPSQHDKDSRKGAASEHARGTGAVTTSPVIDILGDAIRGGADFLSRPFVLTILLVVGLPGLILLLLVSTLTRESSAPQQVAACVAQITRTHRVVWNEGQAAFASGARLRPGQRLRLAEGLTEVTFDDGAKVVLEGPVTFRIGGRNAGALEQGLLAASVPPSAHGFTVRTPLTTVVDLGTEFGVSVDASGASETHVFVGQVKLGLRSSARHARDKFELLDVGQAKRVEKAAAGAIRAKPIALAPRRFVRRLPPESNAGLPEPTIVFRHEGDRDPATEGWERFNQQLIKPAPVTNVGVGPVNGDDETPAWSIDDRSDHIGVHYKKNRPSLELVAEGQAKGWVMRVRLKVSGHGAPSEPLCFCSYWPDKRNWVLRFAVDAAGNQRLILPGDSSLGKDATINVPNSRDAYVDYEVRYHPETDDADVFINGKLAATGYYMARPFQRLIHFGTFDNQQCKADFARVEWGIVRQNEERHE